MQFADAFCYTLLVITTLATCALGEDHKNSISKRKDRQIIKRDTSVLIDNFPIESSPVFQQRPKIIYRRISRQKYGPTKTKYGPPRPKYGPPKPGRKPGKKYRSTPNRPKYGPPGYKKRSPSPRYGPPKRPSTKPSYGPPKKLPRYPPPYNTPEPAGFGEPPSDFVDDYQPPKQSYGEPPVDSYGSPLRPHIQEPAPSIQSYSEVNVNPYDTQDYNFGPEYQSWQSFQRDQNIDNNFAYSKKHKTFVKPDEEFDTAPPLDYNDDFNPYPDIYGESLRVRELNHHFEKKKKPYNPDAVIVKRPWKSQKLRQQEPEDEILVGGQYAEPPARYVPKFQPSAPMYPGDEDFIPTQRYLDSEVAASATISPYVNYKHSNMAFSPQNLNDAFSIIDK